MQHAAARADAAAVAVAAAAEILKSQPTNECAMSNEYIADF